ncbi:N-acetylmuramoyl-L-alanine amidase [Streptomyces paromomycinus]|uniref:Peptidoglycan-binding protein n=1 Tax=Streptomyces paromomycinus TaxID=92743 RepID=A0A401W9T5_STREY|nr:peptidoglycan recognition family protein [Streptomyces paromomycinus]GCD46106.1 peptidoglycan-binding protein [Streptomyces paromomycinus]
MAPPLSADRFLAALRSEGVRVIEVGNWRAHNRNSRGAWGPVHGIVVHHTVSSGTASSVQLCRDGYSSLPGPLCHGVIAKDGTVHLVGYGRANHAGGGCPTVLRQVTDESYGTAPSRPTRGNLDGTDGNHAFYGFECINLGNGKDPWPAAQLDAIERVSAAICRAHGWTAKSVIGHLEWSKDKVDPRGFTMPPMRARIARRLAGKPSTPTTPEEHTVALTDADVKKIWAYELINPIDKGPDPTRQAGTYLRYADHRQVTLLSRLDAALARLDHIEAALKTITDRLDTDS